MRILQGIIVSNKMQHTVVVRVDRLKQHPKYRKFYPISKKYKAHIYEAGSCHVGDVVRIQETRPVSKDKRWRVVEVVRRAAVEEMGVGASET
ncbi:MAG: 30S ribosomal protein S17 [Patescibacteria group bacterium]